MCVHSCSTTVNLEGPFASLVTLCTRVSSLVLVRRGKLPVWYRWPWQSCRFGPCKTRVVNTGTNFKIVCQFGTFVHSSLPIQYPCPISNTLFTYNITRGRKFKFELRGYTSILSYIFGIRKIVPIQYIFSTKYVDHSGNLKSLPVRSTWGTVLSYVFVF